MIVASLLAIAPVALALPSAHDIIGSHHQKRTGPPAGTSVVPSVNNGGTIWYNDGCYDELKSGLMALNHDISSTLTSITVENCVAGCSAAGYTIAGVMNGNQCLCDNAISANAPALDATQCDVPCTGNTTEVCGGVWHYDIYSPTPTPLPNPVTPPTVGSCPATFTSMGCYQDNTSNRTLPLSFTTSNAQTPAACAATCYSLGYILAGVEWGKECYCGDALINPDLIAATSCAQACSGDSTQTCGGEATINVYALDLAACTSSSTTTTSTTQPTSSTPPPNTNSCTTSAPPTTTSTHHSPGGPKCHPTCGNNDDERYLHMGCYSENTWQRTLNSYSFSSNTMTATTCSSKCYSKGYTYAALENGNTCYCGNNCPSKKTSLGNCNKTCGGDGYIGGGSNGNISVYKSFQLGYPQQCWPKSSWGNNRNGGGNDNDNGRGRGRGRGW